MTSKDSIPVRKLLFRRRGEQLLQPLVIRIRGPYLVRASKVKFKFDEGTSGCMIHFSGLCEDDVEVFGIDKLHALSLAVDVDPYLKGMSKKYEFFWESGDPYFDD